MYATEIGEPTSHKDRSNAVHGSCPQRPRWKFVACVTLKTEILTIEGGQKDVVLRRTNIKKDFF